MSQSRVRRLRAENVRLWAKTSGRFVRTTDSDHRLPVAGNILDRDVEPANPNEPGCADITYIPTREGWLYPAVVEGLFSHKIAGGSMDQTMESRLVVDARSAAMTRRRPGGGLLAHSDRGSRYASEHYQGRSREERITCSMSGVGQCRDNAPMESFFGRLKREIASGEMFAARDQARAEIFEYPEVFDNRVRLHPSPGLRSPDAFERTCNQKRR